MEIADENRNFKNAAGGGRLRLRPADQREVRRLKDRRMEGHPPAPGRGISGGGCAQ